jgi:hypothetical protein
MPLVRLISWNNRALKIAGFTVDHSPVYTSQWIGRIRDLAPAAVLIDLDGKASHGRAVASLLNSSKSTSHIPIVFAGGLPDRVERARRDFPHAVFSDWKNAGAAVQRAAKAGPQVAAPTTPYMRQWAGSTLIQKLGLKGETAALNAPEEFEELLGELPEGVGLRTAVTRNTSLAIWFVRTSAELESEVDFMAARLGPGRLLWIAYPKRAGHYASDLNQSIVRAIALRAGLVDFKICSISGDWSAMKFTRKKSR